MEKTDGRRGERGTQNRNREEMHKLLCCTGCRIGCLDPGFACLDHKET